MTLEERKNYIQQELEENSSKRHYFVVLFTKYYGTENVYREFEGTYKEVFEWFDLSLDKYGSTYRLIEWDD